MSRFQTSLTRLRERAADPIDGASLVMFRILFGLVCAIGALRFLVYGWVERFFERPDFFFSYYGFEFVSVLPAPWMHAVFSGLAGLGLLIAFPTRKLYRATLLTFLLGFTYVELVDVTNYLNHYYLVSLLTLWLVILPPFIASPSGHLRRGMLYVLRVQVACVYVYAAVAKMTSDWLIHGEPLQIWLASRIEVPFVATAVDLFGINTTALIAAWVGMLHDLLIVPALLWRRTRHVAFVALMGFHLATHLLFNIGMFPLIMTVAATVFLDPSWPRRLPMLRGLFARFMPVSEHAPEHERGAAIATPHREMVRGMLIAALLMTQLLVPLRAFAYGGNVLWHEQGMRFSWRVMCREKNGSVSFRVRRANESREVVVPPSRYLTDYQEREMSSQPDLILQLAHHIGELYTTPNGPPEVRVDALVSLNGRPMAPLVDPDRDLMEVRDGHLPATWILPAPTSPPHAF